MSAVRTDQIVGVFLLVCVAFGLFIGCIGFGFGLIFLSVQQSIGIGILSFGGGGFIGAVFGGKRILKAVVETFTELENPKAK
jgi:phosphate/sulfate permease